MCIIDVCVQVSYRDQHCGYESPSGSLYILADQKAALGPLLGELFNSARCENVAWPSCVSHCRPEIAPFSARKHTRPICGVGAVQG